MPILPAEFRWITASRLQRINQVAVALTGEPFGIRDVGLLESAASAPINMHLYESEQDPVQLAVRLLRSVGGNHPFEQGNKRTAFNGAIAFLVLNGAAITIPDTQETAELVLAFIVGECGEQKICEYLRKYTRMQSDFQKMPHAFPRHFKKPIS